MVLYIPLSKLSFLNIKQIQLFVFFVFYKK